MLSEGRTIPPECLQAIQDLHGLDPFTTPAEVRKRLQIAMKLIGDRNENWALRKHGGEIPKSEQPEEPNGPVKPAKPRPRGIAKKAPEPLQVEPDPALWETWKVEFPQLFSRDTDPSSPWSFKTIPDILDAMLGLGISCGLDWRRIDRDLRTAARIPVRNFVVQTGRSGNAWWKALPVKKKRLEFVLEVYAAHKKASAPQTDDVQPH